MYRSLIATALPSCSPVHFCGVSTTISALLLLLLDLEWKVLYVGSAHDSHQDQVLDEILVGPVPVGMNKFVLQADAPAVSKLPENDILGVTVVLVTCSYKEKEFVRVGYYVNNEYTGYNNSNENENSNDPDAVAEQQPPLSLKDLDLQLIQRQILADKPRVTKFPIPWGNETATTTTVAEATGQLDDDDEEEEQTTMMQEKVMMMQEVAGTPSTAATEMDME